MKRLMLVAFCLACTAFAAAGGGTVDPMSWSAVDGLGRFLPEHGTAGAPRKDKWVGIFYWTWHGDYSDSPSNAVNRCWDSKGRNNIGDGDILSVYTDGDAMPGGRFTFRYVADDLRRRP